MFHIGPQNFKMLICIAVFFNRFCTRFPMKISFGVHGVNELFILMLCLSFSQVALKKLIQFEILQ